MLITIRRACQGWQAAFARSAKRCALALVLSAGFFAGSASADILDPNVFTSLGTLNVTSGTLTINTDTLAMSGAATFTGVAFNQEEGPQIAVFDFSNITIGSSVTVSFVGSRPLALLSRGNVSISPTLTIPAGTIGGYRGASGADLHGLGPGAGLVSNGWASGGGYGGIGGTASSGSVSAVAGGAAYGNLFETLQGGSSGATASSTSATGGHGGGAIEIVAVGSLSANVTANGSVGSSGGSGAGGGVILSGGSLGSTFVSVNGGNNSPGGGGGRIYISGISTYTIGVSNGNYAADGGGNGFAGVVTLDPLITVVPSGRSITLDGSPIISVAGSGFATETMEAIIRRDLTINSGGSVTLGINTPLNRTSGGLSTANLSVDGTFNMNGYNQKLASLTSTSTSGSIAIPTGSMLTLEGTSSSTYQGSLSGSGTLQIDSGKTQTLNGFGTFSGSTQVTGTLNLSNTTLTNLSKLTGTGTVSLNGTNGTLNLADSQEFKGQFQINAAAQLSMQQSAPSAFVVLNHALASFINQNASLTIGSLQGSGSTYLWFNRTLSVGAAMNSGVTYSGTIDGQGNLAKVGTGNWNLTGSLIYTGTTDVKEGILNVFSPMAAGGRVQVHAGAKLLAGASIARPISGVGSGSLITVDTNAITLGDSTSFTGFSHAGTLDVSNYSVTLASRGFANLGVLTSLSGGTINAANGVSLGVGSNLSGSGTVSGKVAAGFGSTIEASGGNLTLGNSSSSVGFVSDGEIYTGTNTVTLNDSNQAVLGAYTQVGTGGNSGTLAATNGLLVDQGQNLEGQGAINSTNTLAKAVIMNGYTNGTGTGLVFNGYVKGIGTFDGTVVFNGTYAPGLSPASTTLNNVTLGSSSMLQMELGGTQLGAEYDHLNITGTATFNGTLDVVLINGFQPTLGNSFNLFDGNTAGSFSSVNLPTLGSGLAWDVSQLYSTGNVSITAIPEPGTFALLGLGLAGLTLYVRKRRVN